MGKFVEVDLKSGKELTRHLKTFARTAVPHAARNALNSMAYEARGEYVAQAKKTLTMRNTYTVRSIQYTKARGTDMQLMQSSAGSTLPYMADREEGETKRKKGKHGVPIPTSSAAGQGMKARPRTRSVRKRFFMHAISLPSRAGGSRKRRNAAAIRLATKHGGVAFLDLGRRKGLFSVTGRKRGLRIRMLWDLSRSTVKTPEQPMLERAVKVMESRIVGIMERSLLEQLRRRRVFGY